MDKNKVDLAKRIGARVQELREDQGLKLKELSEITGLSSSFLSRMEHGATVPSIQTLQIISDSLKVDIGYLFKEEEKKYVITYQGSRKINHSQRGAKGKVTYKVESLAEGMINPFMDPFVLTCLARDHEGFESVQHGGQEIIYVLEGEIEMTLGKKQFVMKKGDAVYHDSTIPHKVISLSKKPAKILSVNLMPGKRENVPELLR
ncbi:MAG: cupin domain-containing protein [SAR324 cluster bacterium]|nr:cupin domain-containing protein [SAR324 cluster bacterium]